MPTTHKCTQNFFRIMWTLYKANNIKTTDERIRYILHGVIGFYRGILVCLIKVEECNEPSCEALIFPYGVVLFNIFSTICI